MLFERRIKLAYRLLGWVGRAGIALLYLALILLPAACQNDEEGEELSGEIGPGSGGPAVVVASVVTDPLSAPDGTGLGSLSFDASYLVRTFRGSLADQIHYIYVDFSATLAVTVTRISGRPDTPCRFSAALLARDEGYRILASGDVVNDQGLSFHQVNLVREDDYQRFFCTELLPNVGIQIGAASTGGNQLDYEQMHFLLNSVSR